jgi:pilus assembly protein Flp/PilA
VTSTVSNIARRAFVGAHTRWIERNDRGATMVEYALIVAGIAIVLIVAIGVFSGALSELFNRQSNAVNNVK